MENLKSKLDKKAGIYKIENIKNKKVYIGSAVNIYRRRCEHISYLRKDKHINIHLQSSFNKYGEKNFKFIVLEFLEKSEDTTMFKEEILKREQYWIDKLMACNKKYGYNKSPTAGNNLGLKWSDESRETISARRKLNPTYGMLGKKHSQETKDNLSNNKARSENISKALKGRKLSKEHIENIAKSRVGLKHSEDTKKKLSIAHSGENNFWYGKYYGESSCAKRIINLTTGKIYDSIRRATHEYGLKSDSTIISVLIGKSKHAKGCLWAYLDKDDKPIYPNYIKKRGKGRKIINLDTLEVFEKLEDIHTKFNVKRSHVNNVCNKTRNTALGYHWQYYEEYLKEHPEDTDLKGE